MSDSMSFEQIPEKKLPGSLNVLTILTFIGSGLFGVIGSLWQYFTVEKNFIKMEEVMNNPDALNKLPDFAKKMYTPEMMELMRKSVDNKMAIAVLGVLAAALCIYGAIQMRQLKVTGYYLYILGCILPFIASFIFVGAGAFTGIFMYAVIAITVLFIILYAIQIKYLVNK